MFLGLSYYMERPQATIKRPNYSFEFRHERKEKRKGRGFSLGELKAAGLTLQEAKRVGLRFDTRRKSVHEENVEVLKKFVENMKTAKEAEKTQST